MSDEQDQDRWARLRFAVVGPLLAAPPAQGELQHALRELSDRLWSHPNDATQIQFGFSTIERWYHTARRAADPVAALRRQRRDDACISRQLTPALCQQIDALYQRHPGWTIQLHYDNLLALAQQHQPLGVVPSYATVRRYFKRCGYPESAIPNDKHRVLLPPSSAWSSAKCEATRWIMSMRYGIPISITDPNG